ncbi:hypothetical protein VIGAN_10209500, partial [Vigna angularis var. angularis]
LTRRSILCPSYQACCFGTSNHEMINWFGSLLKSDSNFTESADPITLESNFIVSLTLPAVLHQPLSNPLP